MKRIISQSFTLFVLLASFLLVSWTNVIAQNASTDFTFFRVTGDKKLYDQNPGNYNKEGSGKSEIYIERKPSLTLKANEVQSITIARHRIPVDERDALEALAEEAGYKPKKKDSPRGFEYSATLSLTEAAAKRWREFANNTNAYVQWRFADSLLGESAIIGPFTSDGFSIGLKERNKEKIAEIFAPLKSKLTWKD